jgi:hypothetical protein
MINAGSFCDHKQTVGLVLSEVSCIIYSVPVIKSMEQFFPKVTLSFSAFL